MNWLGAEFAVAAVADRLLPVADVTGAWMIGTQGVPFPDDRYRTVALAWRRTLSYELSSPENQLALRIEGEQLARGPRPASIGPIDVGSTRDHARRPLVLDVTQRAQREYCASCARILRCRLLTVTASSASNSPRSFRRRHEP